MGTTKLDKETKDPAYRRFVPDQVLTASQLNDVIDHFECQNRFTRICLNGVGIACGLAIKYSKNKSIEVTKGCAVTTDGDLIPFSGVIYTHVKTFDDVEAKYSRFNGINLIELLTDEASDKSNVKPLNTVVNLETMVVVLYLEYFCKEETPCTSTDCDTQGEGQSAKVRMLLISKDAVKKFSNKDNDPILDAHNNTKKFIDLPNVNLKKVILKNSYLTRNGVQVISQNSNTASYFRLKDSYKKSIQDTTVIADLKNGINKLFTDFKVLLNTDSLGTKANTINNKITALFKLKSRNLPLDIQYRYDLLKDLIDTYNEIKCQLFDLRIACFPNIKSFPKHLLLGELEPVESFLQCRHNFYPSPIIPHGKEKFEEIRNLITRIHFMLSEYTIPKSSTPIKITPSTVTSKELGKRALPYYFKTSLNLIENWDYDKTKKFKSIENLGYHSDNLSESDAIQNPLDYDLDDHDFYRIEGHLGKDYRNAIRDLDTIKTDKGLAFDIKVLSIDETLENIDPDDYECEFEDLNVVLKAWRAEQNCLNAGISKFFSGFSLKNEGEQKKYKSSDQITAVSTTVTTGLASAHPTAVANPISLESTSSFLTSGAEFFEIDPSTRAEAIKASTSNIPGRKRTYTADTVVLDNLETDDNDLGKIVYRAMLEKPYGSAEDINALVRSRIDLDPEIETATWDVSNKKVTLDNALEILSNINIASKYTPNYINDIKPDRVVKYERTIKDLCGRVERFRKDMTSLSNKSEATIGYKQQYELLLNQLSVNCCSATKMRSLLVEIEARKKKILERQLLSKYVEKHTGLEHKAGVGPGQTFVMVYKGGIRRTRPIFPINPSFENILSDVALNPDFRSIGGTSLSNTSAFKTLGSALPKDTLASNSFDLTAINPNISNSLNLDLVEPNLLAAIQGNFILPPFSNVSENTVVADFTLPYICCSDCSPIAFIVPKTPTSLRLPVDFVCLDAITAKVAFEVSPLDGIVTADVAEGLNGGVTKEGDKFMFDANAVSKELLGKEIEFKVNDQFTDALVTVFKKPKFSIVASEPKFFNENTIATVNFTVNYIELPVGEYQHEWDFGDKSLSDKENPTHNYNLKLGDDGTHKFKVSLIVTNGSCSHTESHVLQIDVDVVDPKKCIDQAKAILEGGLKDFPKFDNFDGNLQDLVFKRTLEIYKKVESDFELFTKGSSNADLAKIFKSLFKQTSEEILERKGEPRKPEFIALTIIFRLQIQVLYCILCCQSKDRIADFSRDIEGILKEIDKSLKGLNGVAIDNDAKLKEFLKAMLDKVSELQLLIKHIKIQLKHLK